MSIRAGAVLARDTIDQFGLLFILDLVLRTVFDLSKKQCGVLGASRIMCVGHKWRRRRRRLPSAEDAKIEAPKGPRWVGCGEGILQQ